MRPDPARRRLLGLGAAATLAALLPACAREMPLRVAAHVWPGYELMFLARSLGWLDDNEVRLIETRNATESLAALARGEVDGAALTLDETLRGRAAGIPLTVVLVFASRAQPNAILDVLAVRTAVLTRRGDAVRALAAAHFLGLRHLQTNPRDASHRMAARLKLPSGEAYGAFRGLQLPSVEVNRRLLASGGEVAATAASLLAAMVHAGILERGDGLQALTSDAYLPRGES